MNKPLRFADPGVELGDFATHFVVHCPHCSGKAHIRPVGEKQPVHGIVQGLDWRLVCTHCLHTELQGRWYGAATAYVSVKCRECHEPLERSAEWNGLWEKLSVQCPACGDNCEYEARITRHGYNGGQKADPVFGLALWLQKMFREDLFWAYNYEHLNLLRQYIGAKLRERGIEPRNTIRKNSAMLSRLPAFMSKAAHREALLKLIEHLALKTT
jgi:hypothetical protein